MSSYWWIQLRETSTDNQPADSPTRSPTRHYGPFQTRGAQLRQWIENPGELACPTTLSQLTLSEIQACHHIAIMPASPGNADFVNLFRHLNLPTPVSSHAESEYSSFDLNEMKVGWHGFIGPGVVYMEDIHHRAGSRYFISELSLAFYRGMSFAAANPIRHVVFVQVIHQETMATVLAVYGTLEVGARWWRTWERGTAEFDALLGSPIGRVVGFLVLGGFQRGTRRIARIHTVSVAVGVSCHMDFEIEVIN